MFEQGGLPAKDRPGKGAWWGPVALGVGLLSWAVPGAGAGLAVVAVICGVLSVATRGAYRVDATALAGIGVAGLQIAVTLLMMAAVSDHQ